MVEHTDLIAMGLYGILKLYPSLRAFPVPFALKPMRLLANWHERSQTDAGHVRLRRLLAEVARSQGLMSLPQAQAV